MSKDLTGKRYGRLTVISKNGVNKHGAMSWVCECDCGNKTTATSGVLNCGKNKLTIEEISYTNTVACDPPLDKNELRSICNSVTRYKR